MVAANLECTGWLREAFHARHPTRPTMNQSVPIRTPTDCHLERSSAAQAAKRRKNAAHGASHGTQHPRNVQPRRGERNLSIQKEKPTGTTTNPWVSISAPTHCHLERSRPAQAGLRSRKIPTTFPAQNKRRGILTMQTDPCTMTEGLLLGEIDPNNPTEGRTL